MRQRTAQRQSAAPFLFSQPRSVAQGDTGAPPDGIAFRRALADLADALHRPEEGIGSVLALTAAEGDTGRLIAVIAHKPRCHRFQRSALDASPHKGR